MALERVSWIGRMASQVHIVQPFKERYTLTELLGHGGMGEVYVARDADLERDVAIKLIHKETSAIPEMRMCFNREARAISLVRHPNVVDIYDFGTTPTGQIYLSTELVHGDSLHGINPCELPLCTIVDLMLQLLRALDLAHSRCLIHRDLKAENVLLTFRKDKLWVKLADFGLASLPSLLDSSARYLDETKFGTPGYMAPEQILHGMHYVGACTDIYATGVLLYEALSGKMPFDRGNALGTMRAHLQAPIPDILWRPHLAATPAPIKRALSDIVRRALDKAPWMRYLTAGEFSQALEELVPEIPVLPLPEDPRLDRIRQISAAQPGTISTLVLEKRDIGAKIRAFEAAEDSGLSHPPQAMIQGDVAEKVGPGKNGDFAETQGNSGLLNASAMRAKSLLFDSIMASVSSSMGANFEFYREILLRTSVLGGEFCLNEAEAFWRNDEDRALADCWREALAAWAQNNVLAFKQSASENSESRRSANASSPCLNSMVRVAFTDGAFVEVCHSMLGARKLRVLKAQAAMALTEVCPHPDRFDLYKIACLWKDANQISKYIKICTESALLAWKNGEEVDYEYACDRFENLAPFYDDMMRSLAQVTNHSLLHAIDWPSAWVSCAEIALITGREALYEKSCERLNSWVDAFSKPVYLAHLQRLNALRHLRRENYIRASELAALSCNSFSICNEEIEGARSQIVQADANIALSNIRQARQLLSCAYETFNRLGLKTDIAQIQLRLARLDWYGGQPLLACDYLRNCVFVFQKNGDVVGETLAHLQLNFIQYFDCPNQKNAIAVENVATKIAQFGDDMWTGKARILLLIVLVFQREWEAIDALEAQCLRSPQRELLPEMNGVFACLHAVRHAMDGKSEAAQAEITTAIAYFGPHQRRARAYCHTLLGIVAIFTHQIRNGVAAFERARSDFIALNDILGQTAVMVAQSTLAMVCEEWDDAFGMAIDGMDVAENANFPTQSSFLSIVGIASAIAAKRFEKVEQLWLSHKIVIPNLFIKYASSWLKKSIDAVSALENEKYRRYADILQHQYWEAMIIGGRKKIAKGGDNGVN